jgi:hypothetical protein
VWQLRPSHRCTFYVRDTAIRGPLLLDAARARRLGFFDEQNLWLGSDDHDFFARAYHQYGWVAGLMRVDFEHHTEYGETQVHTFGPDVFGVSLAFICVATGGSRKKGEMGSRDKEYLEARQRRSDQGFIGKIWQEPQNTSALHDEARKLPKALKCSPKTDWWRALEHFGEKRALRVGVR